MKRKALGKGLSALLPEPEPFAVSQSAAEVPVDQIDPNPLQPRTRIRPDKLEELIASIRESGMVQPILVRRRGPRFEIVAGERRFRAAQALGMGTVPVTVREVPDDRLLELALVENLQREELTPLEEAQALYRLQDEFRLTQEEIAKRIGRERSTVANTLRLLKLPREARELLAEGKLDAGHARALLALDRVEEQLALARETSRRGLSVREVERRVAMQRQPRAATGTGRDPNTRAAEERLKSVLGMRVRIQRRGRAGAMRIEFASESELHRLFELIVRGAKARR
jgi:ParB family chromosome partitioning protein